MKSFNLLVLLSFLLIYTAKAQSSSMTVENIKALDARWEDANLHPDPEFFRSVLAENFVWVHNHATMIDSKNSVVERAERQVSKGTSDTRSRKQSEVRVAITGTTAIITGFTIVDRDPAPTKYHFMRTYIIIDGKCMLIGNHTMAIPEE